MKSSWLTASCFLLASAICHGADLGVATIVDGNARVLRGASWYKLVEGARIQDGDVIDSAERSQVQIEFAAGPIVSIAGPTDIYAVGAGSRESKQPAPAEIYLPQGWLKFSVRPGGTALRVRTPAGSIAASDAVAVVHAEAEALETFTEQGSARLVEPGKGAADGNAHELKGGDFAIRGSDRPFATAGAAPLKFVAAMPRYFRDPLPARAAQYQVARVQLVVDRAISYAEAEPWLGGPYRRAFIKRLQPRLADAEFRAPVVAKLQAYPEWQAALAPQETQNKDKEKDKDKDKEKEKEKNKEKEKAEVAPKAAEKTGPTWWPFGTKR
jgi:FecR-like protein